MRKVAGLLGLTLLVALILLPVTRSVNTTVGNPVLHNGSTQADGTLLLPSAQKKARASAAILVADGSPLPPPPKKPRSTSISFAAREQASA